MVGQKQKQKKKHAKPLPHICLWAWIILLMVASCALSLILFPIFPAWSAILASICAGCVTGIIFYLLTNMRNKVVLEEKEEYEKDFIDEDGNLPETIGSSALNTWIFNEDTIRKVLQTVMTQGLKIDYGEKIGKTIIFAKNHAHAEKILEILDEWKKKGGN